MVDADKKFRNMLLEQHMAHKFADALIKQYVDKLGEIEKDIATIERFYLQKNIHLSLDNIFSCSESPIETIFLNSFLFASMETGCHLVSIMPKLHEIGEGLTQFYQMHDFVLKIWKDFLTSHPGSTPMDLSNVFSDPEIYAKAGFSKY